MKEQDEIPTSKIERASKFISTGMKVGGNYMKHYGKKIIDKNHTDTTLHSDNAKDIYDALSELKGGALKVAQMLSMNDALPDAYNDQFSMAQYNAPPLSYPLVVKTLKKNLGKSPSEVFDSFSKQAINAASIGQVHLAEKDGIKYAVKVQYPGVAESLKTDLKMVKPFATALMNIQKDEVDYYLSEVEGKLIEETDYALELKQSIELSEACKHLPNLHFTKYYPELSGKQVLTMGWVDGKQLKEYIQSAPSQASRNKVGQAIWDFYSYQIHTLRKVHADPHPGNFLVLENDITAVLDFGCVKTIPDDFYNKYFKMLRVNYTANDPEFVNTLLELNMLLDSDTEEQRNFFIDSLADMMQLVGQPLRSDTFNFGENDFFKEIMTKAKAFGDDKRTKEAKAARGLRDAIYVNKTHFGLYAILNELKAEVNTTIPQREG